MKESINNSEYFNFFIDNKQIREAFIRGHREGFEEGITKGFPTGFIRGLEKGLEDSVYRPYRRNHYENFNHSHMTDFDNVQTSRSRNMDEHDRSNFGLRNDGHGFSNAFEDFREATEASNLSSENRPNPFRSFDDGVSQDLDGDFPLNRSSKKSNDSLSFDEKAQSSRSHNFDHSFQFSDSQSSDVNFPLNRSYSFENRLQSNDSLDSSNDFRTNHLHNFNEDFPANRSRDFDAVSRANRIRNFNDDPRTHRSQNISDPILSSDAQYFGSDYHFDLSQSYPNDFQSYISPNFDAVSRSNRFRNFNDNTCLHRPQDYRASNHNHANNNQRNHCNCCGNRHHNRRQINLNTGCHRGCKTCSRCYRS